MKKPFKASSIVMSVLAFVSVAALMVFFCLFYQKDLGNAFAKPFKNLGNFSTNPMVSFVALIVTYVFMVIGFILFILSIVKIKGGRKALGIISSILFMLVPIFGIRGSFIDLFSMIGGESNFVKLFQKGGESLPGAIYMLGMVIFAVLAVLFLLLSVIFCIRFTSEEQIADMEEKAGELLAPAEIKELPAPVAETSPNVASDAIPQQFEEFTAEPIPTFVPQPEPEPAREQPKAEPSLGGTDLNSIAVMIRDIVRDEISRSMATKPEHHPTSDSHTDNHSVVGATFGGPLVVQYFNGGINGVAAPEKPGMPVAQNVVAEPAPAPAEEPAPAPVEEPTPAPVVEETPVEAPVEEAPVAADVAVPAVEPVVEVVPPVEKKPIVRIPFQERMINAEKEMQDNYNEIKNEILSYGVKSRVSNSGDTFRLHCKTYVKLTIAGKSLKLYFALDPNDYADSTIPVQDASNKGIYAEIPLVFKVKSGLSMRRCKDLIAEVMEKDNLEQGEIGTVNWVKEIKATYVPNEKESKDSDDEE